LHNADRDQKCTTNFAVKVVPTPKLIEKRAPQTTNILQNILNVRICKIQILTFNIFCRIFAKYRFGTLEPQPVRYQIDRPKYKTCAFSKKFI